MTSTETPPSTTEPDVRWDLRAARHETPELEQLLLDGWEPFGVVAGTSTYIWLRKRVGRSVG